MDELYYQGTHSGPEIDALLDTVDAGVTPVVGKGINLLDNWYFMGGGSQRTDVTGLLPINQRGQTSYSNISGYGIDRWFPINVSTTYQLSASEITCTPGTAGYAVLGQRFELGKLRPATYTLSLLTGSVGGTIRFYVTGVNTYTNELSIQLAANTLGSFTFASTEYLESVRFYTRGSVSFTAKAAKLELGSEQTLARYENGAWVLNDPPPNYQQELAKCQRHQVALNAAYDKNIGFVIRYSATDADIVFPLPTTMRANPKIITSGTFRNVYNGGTASIPSSLLNENTLKMSGNMASLRIQNTDFGGSGRVDAASSTDVLLILDANL